MSPLTAADIVPGKTFRGKRPVKQFLGGFNDRYVLWVNDRQTRVQYDGPAVAIGRRFPAVDMDRFVAWASHEVVG